MAWADDGSIVLDFVRHGESGDMTVVNTLAPGPDLTDAGEQQAQALVNAVSGNGIDDIYASTMIRSQETAAPLAEALHLPINVLSGLNEIDAGIFEGIPVNVGDLPLGGTLYLLAPLAWTLGLDFVPQLGSMVDPNGVAFDESFSGAVQSIYDGTVGTEAGTVTDAVFSHEGAIATWTLMNVNNPDFRARPPRVPQHRRVAALHGPSRGGRLARGLDPGQLGRDSGAAGPGITDGAVRRLPRPDHGAAVCVVRHLRSSADRQFGDDRDRDSGRSQPNRHGTHPIPDRGV